ncbi:hypothetical protein [Dyadobacter frigoris]|uniref:Uncharacterized protein n=1 Tax=Dyadobacter frigoris TaxID=2576211 RepID=A0A4U6CX12_9BACT|nr:hypothetical protein [Dyadobacter frigoris]TKT89390.1 hypothetical protein FDK13_23875 [Dyadobacter frigoris]GLU55470.1 hypothetical protein Dfri01_49310 [Dyadobacter frigoris]
MNKSNIFVYTELSKLVASLNSNILLSKQYLRSQAAYFNIIVPKYFSDTLSPEWESITNQIRKMGPGFDKEGKLTANAIINTIDQMTSEECISLAMRVISLYDKVRIEFENPDLLNGK